MNHALTFVLQMDWVSNNQYNQNWSKYIIVLYSKLNYKRHAKRLERMDKFIMDIFNRFCYNVQTSAKWFVFVFVSICILF